MLWEEKVNFVIVYINNIFAEEHVRHYEVVRWKQRDKKLCANGQKKIFVRQQIEYLNHVVKMDGIKPNMAKVKAKIKASVDSKMA